jgi:hypothetical protein
MSQFEVTYALKDMFFDRAAVQNRLNKAEHRILSKIGAFIRRRASKYVLRRRKRTSKPGQPPSIHSTDDVASLKNILFGLDATKHSVVIGPVKLNGGYPGQTIPNLMEFGGTVQVFQERMKYRDKKRGKNKHAWWRFNGVKVPYKEYRMHSAVYPARPFMKRALEIEEEKGTLRDAWVGVVTM